MTPPSGSSQLLAAPQMPCPQVAQPFRTATTATKSLTHPSFTRIHPPSDQHWRPHQSKQQNRSLSAPARRPAVHRPVAHQQTGCSPRARSPRESLGPSEQPAARNRHRTVRSSQLLVRALPLFRAASCCRDLKHPRSKSQRGATARSATHSARLASLDAPLSNSPLSASRQQCARRSRRWCVALVSGSLVQRGTIGSRSC
jgi:hypothetical protein